MSRFATCQSATLLCLVCAVLGRTGRLAGTDFATFLCMRSLETCIGLAFLLTAAGCGPMASGQDAGEEDTGEDGADGADGSSEDGADGSSEDGADGSSEDGGERMDMGADSDMGGGDTSALEQAMQDALGNAPAGVEGMTLVVHDVNDDRVLDLTVGDFSTDRRVPIASASKYVSALTYMRLLDDGVVTPEDTPGEVLGWTGPLASATVDQLGAFVSGLPGDHLCTLDPLMTLDDCVATFDSIEPYGEPGEKFRYGSAHMATMGSMAQALTGKTWDTIFEQEIKDPLGIDAEEVRYFTVPVGNGLGTQNPLLAGGLVISIDEYMPILSVLMHRGMFDGETFVEPERMERFFRNDYPDALVEELVVGPYSFGSWLLCGQNVHECGIVGSPGAFGFTPWVHDIEGKPQYYAVLGMKSDGNNGAVFSVLLVGQLMPLIEDYLEENN